MSTLPDLVPVIRVTAMPGDANPYGDIFGGWLMGQMDLAAGSVASRHSGGRAVTIAVEGMKFHAPSSSVTKSRSMPSSSASAPHR